MKNNEAETINKDTAAQADELTKQGCTRSD